MKTPVLETERIILRPLSLDDAQNAFSRWTSDDRVSKYMNWNSHKSIDETKMWLNDAVNNYSSDTVFDWGFTAKENDFLFGSGGLYYDKSLEVFSLGYCIMYDFWNKGYTTEAAGAMIKFAKDVLKIKELFAQHAVENLASGKVMVKNGFVPTGYGNIINFDGTKQKSRTYRLAF